MTGPVSAPIHATMLVHERVLDLKCRQAPSREDLWRSPTPRLRFRLP